MALDIKKAVRDMVAKQERGEVIKTPKDDFFTIEDEKQDTVLAEDIVEKDEEESVDPFDDDPKPVDSKAKPAESEIDKVKFAHKDETPKAEKTEMSNGKTETVKGSDSLPGKVEKVDAEAPIPADSLTKKVRVKTVYGDEELTVEEMEKG